MPPNKFLSLAVGLICVLLSLESASAQKNVPPMKHRLFVLTDITSLESGVLEPDDGQSLVRLLLYSNVIDIEGLGASSNLHHAKLTRPDLILKAIDAYETDLPKLRRHAPDFPSAKYLRARVHAGQPIAGMETPVEQCVGEGKATDLSKAIIQAVDHRDSRPLWIACWGGTADLAQALWTVRHTRTPTQLAAFLDKIRVHAIGDQDTTGAWIRQQFPSLFYIKRTMGFRGMYRDGDTSLTGTQWVEANVKGHGALGELYPIYNGGDRWVKTLGKVQGVKEGDTPSFLNFISGDPMSGWGGTFVQVSPNLYDDETAQDASPQDIHPSMAGVYRHRREYQEDFAKRLDWCKE